MDEPERPEKWRANRPLWITTRQASIGLPVTEMEMEEVLEHWKRCRSTDNRDLAIIFTVVVGGISLLLWATH